MTRAQKQERDEAIERLRGWLKPGQTVYTVLRHVSRSGMQRVIDVVAIDAKDGEMLHLGFNVAKAIGRKPDRERGGVVTGGFGMDLGFELVYELGRALWPNGTPEPHGTRNGQPDRDGGYALKYRWI